MRRARWSVPCVVIALTAVACGEETVRTADQDPGLLAPAPDGDKGQPLGNPVVDDAPRDTPTGPQADTSGGPSQGSCAAGKRACGAVCVTLASDSRNCGACGHSCLLGQCANSQCQAFGFVGGLRALGSIHADSENVYWTDAGQLFMSNKTGNVVTKLALTGATSAKVIASDDKAVYFYDTDNATFGRTSRTEVATTTLFAAPKFRGAFKTFREDMYWAERSETSSEDRILTGTTKGGEVSLAAMSPTTVREMAVDAKHVYWTTVDGRVLRSSRFGGCATSQCVETIARDQAGAGSVTVDSTHVYWANEKTGVVVRANKETLAMEAFVSGRGKPGNLTVDYGGVYFTVEGTNGRTEIAKGLLSGDGVIVLGTSAHPVGNIAVDATAIYWTDRTDGVIHKLAK
ncbi:MAG: hypothetical protein U0169_16715 [Polyangiaceae bacterium]